MFIKRRLKVCSNVSVKIIVCGLIFMMLLLTSEGILGQDGISYGTSKADDKQITVRVAYFPNGAFMSKNTDGSYAGYDIEYYYTIAGYANWKIKIVEFKDLDSALAGLKNGKVDVMSGLSITPERSSAYIVSNQKMCTAHIAVQVREDDDRYEVGDTSTMRNMSCGILAGSNVVTLYRNWCRDNRLAPHIVEYATLDKRNAALKTGKVDAIAGGSTVEGAQKIAEFPSLDLYFMFNKDKSNLKTQLDRAMSIMSLEDPTYTTNLFEKYFPASKNKVPSFSASEKAFIKSHSTIKVALLKDDAPFSSATATGKMKGFLPEYYRHLGKVIGVTFKFTPYSSKEKACAALKGGKVDILGKADDDVFDASNKNIVLANAYLKTNIVRITRAGNGKVYTAAVPKCNYEWIEKVLTAEGSSLKVKVYKNSEDCFAALKSKNVDAVICTQPAATWLLNKNRASEYVTSAFGDGTWNVTCAFNIGTEGNTLRAIVDKVIAVDSGYLNQLISRDLLDDSADPSSFFNKMSVGTIIVCGAIALFLLVIAIIALIIIVRRRRADQELAEQRAELRAIEETNKARHAFFGTVSHDMRTPLNGIVGFTDLALKSNDINDMKAYLRKIKTSGNILSSLVNDTLIMSRMENGKYILSPAPNDIADLIGEVNEAVGQLAEAKGVQFTNNTADVCHRTVMVDKVSLQKVFINLLTNAIKFTPEGGKVIFSCGPEIEGDDNSRSLFVVSDTGCGMSREFLPHVFEPFAQEDVNNAGANGSGLGLSIVKSIVDAMGGAVDVKSTKGQGTEFIVKLKFDMVENEEQQADSPEEIDTSCLKGKHVLICEDNELNMEIVENILSNQGVEVTGMENGKLGVDAFMASEPGYYSAVLLDLRMPVMDGNTAAREIRAMNRPDAVDVPIFAISADAYPENIEASMTAGMNGHISKPVDAGELLKALVNALKA